MTGLNATEYDLITLKNTCPDCGANGRFLMGPCGGGSQNLTCAECSMRFNIGPGSGERIGKEERLRLDPIPLPEGTMSWSKHSGFEYLLHSCGGCVEFRAIDHITSVIQCGLCGMRLVFKDQRVIDLKPGPYKTLSLFEYIRDNNPLIVSPPRGVERLKR